MFPFAPTFHTFRVLCRRRRRAIRPGAASQGTRRNFVNRIISGLRVQFCARLYNSFLPWTSRQGVAGARIRKQKFGRWRGCLPGRGRIVGRNGGGWYGIGPCFYNRPPLYKVFGKTSLTRHPGNIISPPPPLRLQRFRFSARRKYRLTITRRKRWNEGENNNVIMMKYRFSFGNYRTY